MVYSKSCEGNDTSTDEQALLIYIYRGDKLYGNINTGHA